MSDTLCKRAHGRLFFRDWSIADPATVREDSEGSSVIGRVHRACFPFSGQDSATVTLSREDAIALEEAAIAYLHLTTHPAGVEAVVRQLRAIRRAVKDDAHE